MLFTLCLYQRVHLTCARTAPIGGQARIQDGKAFLLQPASVGPLSVQSLLQSVVYLPASSCMHGKTRAMQQAYNILLKMRTTEVEILDEVRSHSVGIDLDYHFSLDFWNFIDNAKHIK